MYLREHRRETCPHQAHEPSLDEGSEVTSANPFARATTSFARCFKMLINKVEGLGQGTPDACELTHSC